MPDRAAKAARSMDPLRGHYKRLIFMRVTKIAVAILVGKKFVTLNLLLPVKAFSAEIDF
jgi:hypothetical protein